MGSRTGGTEPWYRGWSAGSWESGSRPLTSFVFITMTNTCLLPTLILLSLAMTGCMNSRDTSYRRRSSPSFPAVALNVMLPSSSRSIRGCSGLGRSMVMRSRSLRCAHSTVGVSVTPSSGIVSVSVSVGSARLLPAMGRTRADSGARACVPPHTRARVRDPHRRQPRKRSRLSSQENQTRLFERVDALDGRTAQRAGARGTMEAPFQPRRFAVKFNPPRFLLEYSDGGKKRVRSVRSHTPSPSHLPPLQSAVSSPPSLPPSRPPTATPHRRLESTSRTAWTSTH